MKRRILAAILSVASLAIILFAIPLGVVVTRFVNDAARLQVERQAVLATRAVPADFESAGDPVELPVGPDGITFGLYDQQGRLVAGSGPSTADTATIQALANRVVDATAPHVRIVAVPVASDEQVVGVVRAEQSTASSTAQVRTIIALLAALATGVVGLGGGLGYLLARRLAAPLVRLRDAAVDLGHGDFGVRVPPSTIPELDDAATALNATAQRLEALIARERSFSADASHQLRTPLAGLKAAIETELRFPRADRFELLNEALVDIERFEETISDLLRIARSGPIDGTTVDLASVFDTTRETWSRAAATAGREFVVADTTDCPPLRADRQVLCHVLDVLVDNALRHGKGPIRLMWRPAADAVVVSVGDDGPGFGGAADGDAVPVASGELHGLGLPLARRLTESMSGRLSIARSGPRPRIDITLPAALPRPA